MTFAPDRSRQQLVRDIPDEHVVEPVLLVALEGGDRLAADELSALELGERIAEAIGIRGPPFEHPAPEDPARDGRIEENGAPARRQGVEASRDDLANGGRKRRRAVAGLRHRGCELLDEERVPICDRGQVGGPLDALRGPAIGQPLSREPRRVGGVERGQLQRRMCKQAAAPIWSPVEQLGTGEREHQHGEVAKTGRKLLDEVEERDVGPVQVLEHEQRRVVRRHRLDEASDREEEALAVGDRAGRIEPKDDPEMLRDLLRLRLRQKRGYGVAELLRRHLGTVRLEDSAKLLELERQG
jgi:hypothetical protein